MPARLDDCEVHFERLAAIHYVDLFPQLEVGFRRIAAAILGGQREPAPGATVGSREQTPTQRLTRQRLETYMKPDPFRRVELTNGLWANMTSPNELVQVDAEGLIMIGAIGEETFEIRIPIARTIMVLTVPYGLVQHAWLTVDQQLALRLDGRPVLRNRRLVLEP